jgi:hypothetical protein
MEDVQAELNAAAVADGAIEAPEAPAAEQAAPEVVASAPKGESEPQTEEQPAGDSEVFAPFNPDTLPPELVPAWKQLQGAFTRKTQELAEREKQFEALGPVEDIEQAVDLYTRLSDPENWPQLHQELTEALEEAGMTPRQAEAEASRMVGEATDGGFELDTDDPELAPYAKAIRAEREARTALQARLDAFESRQNALAETEEAERAQQYRIFEMNRQAAAIRQANPGYDDTDIGMTVKLGSFYNDDLIGAQADLEAYVAHRMERYLASKQSAQSPSLQPSPGAGIDSEKGPTEFERVQDVEDAAVADVRALMDAGEFDFS